jgi:flagellar hook-associated protein 3
MRITSAMMMGTYLSNLNGNLNRLSKYLEQESTGKSINKISDDPVKTTLSLSARNKLSSTKRYQENAKAADSRLTEVESAVRELNDIIEDAYQRAVQASNDWLSGGNLAAIAEEIRQLMDETLNIANVTYGDNYLFAGYNSAGNAAGDLPFIVDQNGDLFYNGINMSNEASVEEIADAANSLTGAIAEAGAADALAQSASPSSFQKVIDAVSQVSNTVRKMLGVSGFAVSAARDLVKSSDLSGTETADLLEGAANLSDTAVSEAKDALAVAENAVAAAQAAAESVEAAYAAWQAAKGTDGESDAFAAYTDAQAAAEAATAAAQTASGELMNKAGAMQASIDGIHHTITSCGELYEAYNAVSEAKTKGADLLANGDYAGVAAQTSHAANAAGAAIAAVQKLASVADETGATALYTSLTAAIAATQTAALEASDAAALVTDDVTAAAAQAKTEALETAITDLQSLLGGYSALSAASAGLDRQSEDVLSFLVGPSQTMEVSVPGTDLMGRGKENLYVILSGLHQALSNGADADEINDYIKKLQDRQDSSLALEAKLGAQMHGIDMMLARYTKNIKNYTQMKSDAEDADLAEVITNYTTAQTVYNAALAAGSKIIQTSLLDFLR